MNISDILRNAAYTAGGGVSPSHGGDISTSERIENEGDLPGIDTFTRPEAAPTSDLHTSGGRGGGGSSSSRGGGGGGIPSAYGSHDFAPQQPLPRTTVPPLFKARHNQADPWTNPGSDGTAATTGMGRGGRHSSLAETTSSSPQQQQQQQHGSDRGRTPNSYPREGGGSGIQRLMEVGGKSTPDSNLVAAAAVNPADVEQQIHRLQMIITEMRHNAVAAERSLHELMFDLKQKTEEAERLKSQLQLTPHQVQEAMEAREPWDPELDQLIKSLVKSADATQAEITRDQDEKIMLLRRVDRHLNGGPAATLADTHLFTRFSRSRAATTFTKVVEVLPKGNVERLNDAQFFEYCKGTVNAAVVQYQRRRTAVDVESALMTGLHYAGHRANLTRICAAVDEEDLYKL